MMRLEKLSEATDQVLHGLTADSSLKQRILRAAASPAAHNGWFRSRRMVSFVCITAALLLMIMSIIGLQNRSSSGRPSYFTAATHTSVSPILLRSFLAENIQD